MTGDRTTAGHRVLRLLARGDRSDVWLAADDLVLKVVRAPVPAATVVQEATALHRARGDHVIELHDTALAADEAVLIFPRMPRGSLTELLTRRTALEAGEAVTILAPIAAALDRMHAAGVAHTALSPGAVLFRADGAPVLTGFGRAHLHEPGLAEVALERLPGVIADRTALRGLADTVLSRVGGPRAAVAARLRDGMRAAPVTDGERLARELFELAAARPIGFEAEAETQAVPVGRIVPVAPPVAALEPRPVSRPRDVVERVVEWGPASVARDAVRGRWATWSVPRRRAVLGAAAAGLVLVVTFAVLPGPEGSGTVQGAPDAGAAGPAETAHPEQEAGTAADTAIMGDDPVAALRQLAARRMTCFRELSVLCLDGVAESGSSALDADRAQLRAVLDGGIAPTALEVSAAQIIERLGGSALVGLAPNSDPASVLLVKGEAGWRIRDYLAPVGDAAVEE